MPSEGPGLAGEREDLCPGAQAKARCVSGSDLVPCPSLNSQMAGACDALISSGTGHTLHP